MKYNYVIFGSEVDFLKLPFSEVIGRKNVKYLGGRIDSKNRLLNFLCRVHFNKRINRIIPLPFKRIWYPLAFKGRFDDDKPICFVFFNGIWFDSKFFKYLRKKYPDCKIALYNQDLLKYFKTEKSKRALSDCDAIAVYDKDDAIKYGAIHCPAVFSFVPVKAEGEEYDVCCIIKAKDRLKKAIALYDRLNELGLKSYFYIKSLNFFSFSFWRTYSIITFYPTP